MNFNKSALFTVLSLVGFGTLAAQDADYQHEVSLSTFDYVDGDFSQDATFSANYRYYISPVSQKNVPYALSEFLAHTSNVGVEYGHSGSVGSYSIDGQYVFDSNFFVNAGYQTADVDYGYDLNNYNTTLGYYLNDTTSLYINYGRTELVSSYFETDTTNYAIGGRSFFKFDGEQGLMIDVSFSHFKYAGKFESALADTEYYDDIMESSSNNVNIKADYYINNAWSLGANYSRNSEAKTNVYGLQTAYFWRLSDSMSLQAFANKALKPSNDGFGLGLTLLGRF